MKKYLYLILLLIILFTGCTKNNDKSQIKTTGIQIKGSDTMVNLTQAWAEAFIKKYPGKEIAVTGGGSGTGISSLINGTCDIAQSSRLMAQKEIDVAEKNGVNPLQYNVAMDGIAVVVNPSNSIKQLTLDQVRDIFMKTVTNWKEVGGSDMNITLLSREVNSGTHVFFKEHVLRKGNSKSKEEFAPEALLMPSSQAIADEIAYNPEAIGYYGMGYIFPGQKVIAIAKENNGKYYEPTEENVVSGKYPISRPLLLYVNCTPVGEVKEFIEFALSDQGQKIVKEVAFVPLLK
jgi:phosphate transport system substrate-binding protein